MPLKLNVGLSKKIGESNYGSRGACVNLELELDGNVIQQPDRLQEQIRRFYDLARESIKEELARPESNGHTGSHNAAEYRGRNRHGNGNGNGRTSNRPATASQVKAIYAIAKRNDVDLESLLQGEYGASRPEDLTLPNANSLIDELKSLSSA